MEKHNISFSQALDRIIADEEKILSIEVEEVPKEGFVLDVIYDQWNEDYLYYWGRYGIDKPLLEKYSVFPVRTVFKNETLYMRNTKTNPIYGYKFPSGNVKLYRPLSPDRTKKWRGNATVHDIGGLPQLPSKGVLTFLTSSLKDVMVLKTLGFPAVCLNAEGITSEDVLNSLMNTLKKRYRYVVVFMDNDEAGIKSNISIATKYRLRQITTQSKFKDISDYIRHYGYNKTLRMLKKLLSKQFKSVIDVPY